MIVKLTSQQILTTLQMAARYLQSGLLPETAELCQQVLASAPDQPDALHLLAISQARAGRSEIANDYFLKAIAASPARSDFCGNYANALWEQGRFAEAEAYCTKAISLNRNNADAHNVQGNICLSRNLIEQAAECFRLALSLRPAFPQALNNLGIVSQLAGKLDDAIAYYQQAIDLQEGYCEAYNNLGQALKLAGRIAEAAECFRKALEIRPDSSKAKSSLMEVNTAWLEPLEGNRLLLRRYQEEDAAFLHECYSRTDFLILYNQYIPRNLSHRDVLEKINNSQNQHPCQLKAIDWIVLKKQSLQPIGIVSLAEIQFIHRRAEFLIGFPERTEQAAGYGTEATLLVFDFVFNVIGLNKLTSVVYAYNKVAQKNALAVGFQQESYLRQHLFMADGSGFVDVYANGILKTDLYANKRIAKLSQRLLGRDITLHGCP